MKRVLIDASSAILLHKADNFQDMAEHYRLMMVPTVLREINVAHLCGAEAFQEARDAGKIDIVPPFPRAKAIPSLRRSMPANWRR